MVKIALVLQKSAFDGAIAREAQDMLLALAAVEHQVSVIYLDAAVLQLRPTSTTAQLGCKDFTPTQKLFGLYDIEQLFVSAEAMVKFNLTPSDLRIPVQICAHAELKQHLQQQQYVLRF
jgi:tRNA 2-thiouridine synthesizing protein C